MPITLPQVRIDTPKMRVGEREIDLSDHYPITMEIDGIKIISYNLQLMHTFLNKAEITPAITQQAILSFAGFFSASGADLCCVQELFDKDANLAMERAMNSRGYRATELLDRRSPSSIFNGGVRFFVKNGSIDSLQTRMHIYQHKIDYFIGADAITNKGASQVSFSKNGKKYHVFNTHLQAYYPNRDHYAEMTLAQCIELKKIIEKQCEEGIIHPDDCIVLCGDFNIPKPYPTEKETLLYKKMTCLMGQKFTFLNYDRPLDPMIYTRSLTNTHNHHEIASTDNNVNLDMGILYRPAQTISPIDSQLADIYCEIQLSIAAFVEKNTSLFSAWLLSDEAKEKLQAFNVAFDELINNGDALRRDSQNPFENTAWINAANTLRLDLHTANTMTSYAGKTILGVTISVAFILLLPAPQAILLILALAGTLMIMNNKKIAPPERLSPPSRDGMFSTPSRTEPSLERPPAEPALIAVPA